MTAADHLRSPQKYYFAGCIYGSLGFRRSARTSRASGGVLGVILLSRHLPCSQVAGNRTYMHLRKGVKRRCRVLSVRILGECGYKRSETRPAEHLSHACGRPAACGVLKLTESEYETAFSKALCSQACRYCGSSQCCHLGDHLHLGDTFYFRGRSVRSHLRGTTG